MKSPAPPVSHFVEDRSRDRLMAILGRRCRHVTAVIGPEAEEWRQALSRHAGDLVTIPDLSDGTRKQFKTALAVVASPAAKVDDVVAIASDGWALVAPGGRLFVVAVNSDAVERGDGVTMRRLGRRLRGLAPPTFLGDQPFWWLVAELRKRRAGGHPPPARVARFEATVRLCTGDVIELGCGVGDLAAMIHARGHRVVGVDLNAAKIADARERRPGIDFHRGDIHAVAFADGSFDTAVLAEVLEHVTDAAGDRMLERAWRLLRAGGRLIVSVPHEDLVPHRNHLREFSVGSLTRRLETFGRPVVSVDQPFKWILMHVDKR